jgi:dTDP-4-dehydrorhamnose reductase
MRMTENNASDNRPYVPVTAVFGADGFIGRNILAGLSLVNPCTVGVSHRINDGLAYFALVAPDIRSLGLKNLGVTHAVIAAGVSSVAACELEPARTRVVNVTGTVELARQLREEGVHVIALSSDYVFDGVTGNYDEESLVNPLNSYGRQKVEMERLLLESCGDGVLVVRLSKVFDTIRGSGTLLDEMVAQLLSGCPVLAASDQYFCPTFIDDIVAAIGILLTTDHSGILHCCASTKMNRHDLALMLAHAFGCRDALVKKISLSDLGEPFPRPLDTSMVSVRLADMWPFRFRSLDSCIDELRCCYSLI